jgi:hypothetical protein
MVAQRQHGGDPDIVGLLLICVDGARRVEPAGAARSLPAVPDVAPVVDDGHPSRPTPGRRFLASGLPATVVAAPHRPIAGTATRTDLPPCNPSSRCVLPPRRVDA